MAQECVQAAPVKAGAATGRPHRQGASSQVSMQDQTPLGEVAQQGHVFSTSHHMLPGDPVDQSGLWAQVSAGSVTRLSHHPDSMQEKYNNTTSRVWLLPSGPPLQSPIPQITPAQPQSHQGSCSPRSNRNTVLPIHGPEDTQDMTLAATTAAAGPGAHSPWEGLALLSLPSGCRFQALGGSCQQLAPNPDHPVLSVSAAHTHTEQAALTLTLKDGHQQGRAPSAGIQHPLPQRRNEKIRGLQLPLFWLLFSSLQRLCECSLSGVFLDPYGVTSQTGRARPATSALRTELAKPRASVDAAVLTAGALPVSQSTSTQAASVMSQAYLGQVEGRPVNRKTLSLRELTV